MATLSAGLWPFQAPLNAMTWLKSGGLHVGQYGSAVTTNPLRRGDATTRSCSLEIWVKADAQENDGTILAFIEPDNSGLLFAVRQSLGDLELRLGPLTRHPARGTRIYADDAFRSPQWKFLTITSGVQGTNVYSEGRLAAQRPAFRVPASACGGELMIGNAPGIVDSWSGEIKGAAIYNRDLSPDEVARNYVVWTHGGANGLAGTDNLLALFRFNAGTGSMIHNSVEDATDLQIPKHFFVLKKPFLEAPWDEFYMGWSYWGNVVLNIAAFVPLGLAFYALFWSMGITSQRLAATIAVGFAVSLTIEVLQGFLPTRRSGITDLFTNTLGTALGAICFRCQAVHNLQMRIAPFLLHFDRHHIEENASEGIR